ncbi:MAG: FtsQ-type POTRA domain-containing protein [Candidatus Borkfalkia sp.]
MRSKKLVVVYAVILFLIVFLITFNSVCAITQIDARFDVSSADAKQKAEKIQDELDGYLHKNFLFFDTDTVKEIFERKENSHFKVLSVEKSFPNKITVNVREKYECYAFYDKTLQKYAVTDASGEVIALKDDAQQPPAATTSRFRDLRYRTPRQGRRFPLKRASKKRLRA